MMPDFPRVKSDLSKGLNHYFRHRVDVHLGAMSKMSRLRFFEGASQRFVRHTGESETDPFHTISGRTTFKPEELPTMRLDILLLRLDEAAAEFAGSLAQHFYEKISASVEKVGNVTNAKGQGLSWPVIAEALRKLHIDFNRDGSARMPDMHIHPSQAKSVSQAAMDLESNVQARREYAEIMRGKKDEWRTREANRRLVG
jgi:hypothetical protein